MESKIVSGNLTYSFFYDSVASVLNISCKHNNWGYTWCTTLSENIIVKTKNCTITLSPFVISEIIDMYINKSLNHHIKIKLAKNVEKSNKEIIWFDSLNDYLFAIAKIEITFLDIIDSDDYRTIPIELMADKTITQKRINIVRTNHINELKSIHRKLMEDYLTLLEDKIDDLEGRLPLLT